MFECVGCVFFSHISVAVCSIVLRFCMCIAEVPKNSSVKFGSDWLRETVSLSVWDVCVFFAFFPQPIRTKLYTRIPWHLSNTHAKSEEDTTNSYRDTGKKHTPHTLKHTLSLNQSERSFALHFLGTSATHIQNLRTIRQIATEIREKHTHVVGDHGCSTCFLSAERQPTPSIGEKINYLFNFWPLRDSPRHLSAKK